MIPFKIPTRYLGDVAAGTIYRLGTTLRGHDGRIVAHLQETRLLQEACSCGGGAPGMLLSVARLGSSVWANVQLEQVKSTLAALGMLNAATLAASVAGVGVSAAGFALVLRRLQGVERSLEGVHRDVLAGRRVAERVDLRMAAGHRAVVDGLLYRAEEAWLRSDAERVWRELEGRLEEAQRYCRGLVGHGGSSAFLDGRFTLEEAAAAYEAALALASCRVQVLLLIEERDAALHYAIDFERWHRQAVGQLFAVDVAAARASQLAREEERSEEDARSRLRRQACPLLEAMRAAQEQAASRPALLEALSERGVGGRAYIEAVRDRQDTPLLALPEA